MPMFKNKIWYVPANQKRSKQYDIATLVCVIIAAISVFALPNVTEHALIIAMVFIIIIVVIQVLNFRLQKADKKYRPIDRREYR